jgi:hypothetical protein
MNSLKLQGPNFQNFLREICNIFVTSRFFNKVVSCNRASVFDFYSSHFQTSILYILNIDLAPDKLDILGLKITKIQRILLKNFCELHPSVFV